MPVASPYPGGIPACSRWLSVATPPDSYRAMNRTLAGVPARFGVIWHPPLAGTPPVCGIFFIACPVVSLRSTTGYRLTSLRLEESPSLSRIRRAARWLGERARQRAGAGITDGRLGADRGGDGGGEFLAIAGIGDETAFLRVTEVSAL